MHRQSGFTLIEVLLALALLALISTVMISGASGFFNQRDDRPDDRFWQAVNAARQTALESGHPVTLSYNQENRQLQWSGVSSTESLGFSVKSFRFLPEGRSQAQLLGGVLTETGQIDRVRFYPDGTCDAFRVEIVESDNRRETLRIDPWTCAPILNPAST